MAKLFATVKGFGDCYMVTRDGEVLRDGIAVKVSVIDGVQYVRLAGTRCKLARIVAIAFVPNPEKHTVVGFIGDSLDSSAGNLVWCKITKPSTKLRAGH